MKSQMQTTSPTCSGRTILITGGARRIGKLLSLAAAAAGADVIIHTNRSLAFAEETQREIQSLGRQAHILTADLSSLDQVADLVSTANDLGPIDTLVNNAAIFEPVDVLSTTLEDWQRHMNINLTAPFLLSQAFARQLKSDSTGRIINILDWRALRPGRDHFPYTISKAGLAAMTETLAYKLAPHIQVNGLALGAILPPENQKDEVDITRFVPAGRWAKPDELQTAFTFLLTAPAYITGEIIHLDGGRHLA